MAVKTSTILDKILERKREEVIARRKRDSVGSLEQRITEQSPARGFSGALQARAAAAARDTAELVAAILGWDDQRIAAAIDALGVEQPRVPRHQPPSS